MCSALHLYLDVKEATGEKKEPKKEAPKSPAALGPLKSEDAVQLTATAGKITDGKQTIEIKLAIEKPWHIYANPAGNDAAAGNQTTVSIRIAGKPVEAEITYPAGELVKDEVVGDYRIYEKEVVVKAVVKRTDDGMTPLDVSAKIQACTKGPNGRCLALRPSRCRSNSEGTYVRVLKCQNDERLRTLNYIEEMPQVRGRVCKWPPATLRTLSRCICGGSLMPRVASRKSRAVDELTEALVAANAAFAFLNRLAETDRNGQRLALEMHCACRCRFRERLPIAAAHARLDALSIPLRLNIGVQCLRSLAPANPVSGEVLQALFARLVRRGPLSACATFNIVCREMLQSIGFAANSKRRLLFRVRAAAFACSAPNW